MNRREFLSLLLAGAGVSVLAGCQSDSTGAKTPEAARPSVSPQMQARKEGATVPVPTNQARPRVATASDRRVWAWLRMVEVSGIPTSEAAYRAQQSLIDVAMPLNGGRLQGDGTWQEEEWKTESAWAKDLPKLARAAGQIYMPGVGNDREGTLKVLANRQLQEKAAAELVDLALTGRFDSPWDGVYLDIEGIDFSYRTQMSGFLYRVARAVKDAGLLLGISVGAVTQEGTGTVEFDDALDLGVSGEVGDAVDLRLYDYAGPPPRSIAPYWWIQASIEYALKKGAPAEKITAGFATFSQHWPDSQAYASKQITYDQAMKIVRNTNAEVEWVERNDNGLVRESYAQTGPGHVWIHDERTYRSALKLVDEYKLLGSTVFAPGMGDLGIWRGIDDWLKGRA